MNIEERIEIAENLAAEITNKISYASGRFAAKIWRTSEQVRVYWCNGYASVKKDGSIDTDSLKRAQKIDADRLIAELDARTAN